MYVKLVLIYSSTQQEGHVECKSETGIQGMR